MVKIRNYELTRQRSAYSCLRTYLEKGQNLKWLIQMIEHYGAYGHVLSQALDQLEGCGDPDGYREAKAACKEQGLI